MAGTLQGPCTLLSCPNQTPHPAPEPTALTLTLQSYSPNANPPAPGPAPLPIVPPSTCVDLSSTNWSPTRGEESSLAPSLASLCLSHQVLGDLLHSRPAVSARKASPGCVLHGCGLRTGRDWDAPCPSHLVGSLAPLASHTPSPVTVGHGPGCYAGQSGAALQGAQSWQGPPRTPSLLSCVVLQSCVRGHPFLRWRPPVHNSRETLQPAPILPPGPCWVGAFVGRAGPCDLLHREDLGKAI